MRLEVNHSMICGVPPSCSGAVIFVQGPPGSVVSGVRFPSRLGIVSYAVVYTRWNVASITVSTGPEFDPLTRVEWMEYSYEEYVSDGEAP